MAALHPTVALYRILDANLDRAREGLRVIEDWCRFGLNDAKLSEQCKIMRQTLGHDRDLHREYDKAQQSDEEQP